MNRSKRINKILKKHLTEFNIDVIDNSYFHKGHNNFNGKDETHILLKLKRITKSGFNRLAVHKKINFLLKEEFETGLHSLQIKII